MAAPRAGQNFIERYHPSRSYVKASLYIQREEKRREERRREEKITNRRFSCLWAGEYLSPSEMEEWEKEGEKWQRKACQLGYLGI
jgi:hypothetical protein